MGMRSTLRLSDKKLNESCFVRGLIPKYAGQPLVHRFLLWLICHDPYTGPLRAPTSSQILRYCYPFEALLHPRRKNVRASMCVLPLETSKSFVTDLVGQ